MMDSIGQFYKEVVCVIVWLVFSFPTKGAIKEEDYKIKGPSKVYFVL